MNNIKNMPTPDKIITDFSQADFIDILKQEIEGVPKVFKKGTVIEESDKEGLVYVIASGQVKVTKNGEIVAFLGEGDMFGLPDFVVKTRAAYTFTVLSKELMTEKYQQAHVLEKLSTIEGSFFYYYGYVQRRLRWLINKEVLLLMSVEKRTAQALLDLALKFGITEKGDDLVRFPKAISRANIAKFLNIQHYKLTETLQQLQSMEAIFPMRRQFLVDTYKLREILEG
ncbi:hypothetical protein PGRAN_09721 [Listeria grandensis FSL F6-0971]|uniref:Cyclic nucleotide-binding domain-containing protein n=1 Tax=Listeria grandensis FSL F6-0971 TaxID=1265819 RepID=W7B7E4_9LIST|nr:Crp/Fnr family transcriptional regulator [Listeria grandensis]EUJ23199.1 hypothetical protein PGRAN_09721 [Listeria grandensis FSL F6-0971]